MSIIEIINGCKAKDRRRQKELYVLTAEDVMRSIQRYINDKSLAKDIFQDTYMRIFDKIHLFDIKRGNIGAWTGKIATNMALAQLRKTKVFSDIDQLPISLHPATENESIDNMSADEVMAIVQNLTESYRIIFLMNVVDGYSHREIAEKIGIKESSSRSQLVRARHKLKLLISERNKTSTTHLRSQNLNNITKANPDHYGNS